MLQPLQRHQQLVHSSIGYYCYRSLSVWKRMRYWHRGYHFSLPSNFPDKPWNLLFAIYFALTSVFTISSASYISRRCIYDGHLRTDMNWFGYLANISVFTTGRMTFEFSYHADRCCQNILFYSEEQMAIINARMNCWAKEHLLRPEDDQILRLTPRFSWSGCHMTHPNGIPMYVCEGGRSFTIDQHALAAHPTKWFIAVSNCATLNGLELQYRIVIHGHVGECPSRATEEYAVNVAPALSLSRTRAEALTEPKPSEQVCKIDGELNITSNWYGFLANISLGHGGGFHFRVSYPQKMRVQSLILYREEDLFHLKGDLSCWHKMGVIRTRHMPHQILSLDPDSSWNGCLTKNETSGAAMLECRGERRYDEPRMIYMAVSNCESLTGLVLNYHFEIYGHLNDVCKGCQLSDPTVWLLASLLCISLLYLIQ